MKKTSCTYAVYGAYTFFKTVNLLLAMYLIISGFYRMLLVDSLLTWPISNSLLLFLNFILSICFPTSEIYWHFRDLFALRKIRRRFSSLPTASESELTPSSPTANITFTSSV